LIEFHARDFFNPSAAGEDGHGNRNAEESLRQGSVGRRNGRWEEKQNRQSSENPLRDYRADGRKGEHPQPAALFSPPHPDRQDDGQQPGALRDHAVGVFKFHSADQFRDLIERAERRGPVRNRKTCVVAGDECSGDD
jgi:hypothetical protein